MHHEALAELERSHGLYRKALTAGEIGLRDMPGWFVAARAVLSAGQPGLFEEQFGKIAGKEWNAAEYNEVAKVWVGSGRAGLPHGGAVDGGRGEEGPDGR